jgi:hypothetical protein
LAPEAVVVVFDQVWLPEQWVVVAGTGAECWPQQAGDAPQAIGEAFGLALPMLVE